VVTIESAVTSGLMAAETVRRRANAGDPIAILRAEAFPREIMAVLKYMGLPLAYAAKAGSELYEAFQSRYSEIFPNN
jgi:hypothetical protein